MKDLEVRLCSESDLDVLAELNKQLIKDEKHDNSMDKIQLRDRMSGFIQTDYNAYLFTVEGKVVGYALVNIKKEPFYLRQFFIIREDRRQGLGKLSFKGLLEVIGTKTIDLEVLVWNDIGRSFWKSMGFEERSAHMRLSEGEG